MKPGGPKPSLPSIRAIVWRRTLRVRNVSGVPSEPTIRSMPRFGALWLDSHGDPFEFAS